MALFEPVFEALEKSGARYVVVGGVAVVLHGYARMTADLDVVVDWGTPAAARLLETVSRLGLKSRAPVDPNGLLDPKTRRSWREEKGMVAFTFVDAKNPLFALDLFVEPPLPFEELWSRAKLVSLGSSSVRVAAIEDLIALKKTAGRPQDLSDIEALEILRREGGNG